MTASLDLPQETVFTELEFNSLLDTYLSKLGSQHRTRVLEAAAISFYHQQSEIPGIKFFVCDDAPQFKLITDNLALCWLHEARHYKELSPFVGFYQQTLDKFLGEFWDYYREDAVIQIPRASTAISMCIWFDSRPLSPQATSTHRTTIPRTTAPTI